MITNNKSDKPGLGSILMLAVSAIAILGLYLAIIFKEKMVADRATEFVGTLHTGEHIIIACDHDRFLILPVDTTPTKIGILQGSYTSITKDIDRYEYHPVAGKPTTYFVGCLKVEIVKDPDANWMINIYRDPDTNN